jgi:hypothetical protein
VKKKNKTKKIRGELLLSAYSRSSSLRHESHAFQLRDTKVYAPSIGGNTATFL